MKFSENSENILADKIIKKEVVKQNVPKNNKFKCDECDCSFKREITLRKHRNTRNAEQKSSEIKELRKGQFGFVVKGRKKKLSDIVRYSVEQNEEKLQNEKEVQSVHKEKNNEKGGTGKEKPVVEKEKEEDNSSCDDASEDHNKKDNEEDISSDEDSEDDKAFLAWFDDDGNLIS